MCVTFIELNIKGRLSVHGMTEHAFPPVRVYSLLQDASTCFHLDSRRYWLRQVLLCFRRLTVPSDTTGLILYMHAFENETLISLSLQSIWARAAGWVN